MKKFCFLFVFVLLISLSSCTTNPEAYKSAKYYFGINVDRKLEPFLYEEYWSWTGEGIVKIIYEFDSVSNAAFLNRNRLSNYKNLPIIETHPIYAPNNTSNYISPELFHQFYVSDDYEFIDHPGKYKITHKQKKNVSVASIVLYDKELMKLFMFYCVDHEFVAGENMP